MNCTETWFTYISRSHCCHSHEKVKFISIFAQLLHSCYTRGWLIKRMYKGLWHWKCKSKQKKKISLSSSSCQQFTAFLLWLPKRVAWGSFFFFRFPAERKQAKSYTYACLCDFTPSPCISPVRQCPVALIFSCVAGSIKGEAVYGLTECKALSRCYTNSLNYSKELDIITIWSMTSVSNAVYTCMKHLWKNISRYALMLYEGKVNVTLLVQVDFNHSARSEKNPKCLAVLYLCYGGFREWWHLGW